MQKVVLDTNVLVSALWSKQGNPSRIVEMIFTKEIELYYSPEIMEEYSDVLSREKLSFPEEKVKHLLQEIAKNAILSNPTVSTVGFTDESDRKFYDTAKENDATLITGNGKHYPDEPRILTPLAFLQNKENDSMEITADKVSGVG